MSDDSIVSSAALASAAAGSTTKRSHKEMETDNETLKSNKETSINNTKIDNDALFASGMEKIISAKKELALAQKRVELAQQHMEDIRQQIRDSGELNRIVCYIYVMERMTIFYLSLWDI